MPFDDDDDDKLSWASTETASSWIRHHKSSLPHSPKYSNRQYVPHLSPLYRATFKNKKKRPKKNYASPSSGTASTDDWYYHSNTSSRNLSPLTYSPRVTKDSSTNTYTRSDLLASIDYLNDDSDVEFEPFPWVILDDDDDVTTEPLYIETTGQRKTPPHEKPGLLIPFQPQDASLEPTPDNPGDDSGVHSQTEESPLNSNEIASPVKDVPEIHVSLNDANDTSTDSDTKLPNNPRSDAVSSDIMPKQESSKGDEPDAMSVKGPKPEIIEEEEKVRDQLANSDALPRHSNDEVVGVGDRQQTGSRSSVPISRRIKPRYSKWRRFSIVLLTTLTLAAALVIMLMFPTCCEKTEYLYGIPGLRIHYRTIPPH